MDEIMPRRECQTRRIIFPFVSNGVLEMCLRIGIDLETISVYCFSFKENYIKVHSSSIHFMTCKSFSLACRNLELLSSNM